MAIGTYSRDKDDYAEVAFVVHDDFHGLGIAGHMLGYLETIARENNFIGFVATVMQDNEAMLRVFEKHYPHMLRETLPGGEILVTMPFELSDIPHNQQGEQT
jgi:GNAT superfamily N-acetyltransferase